MPEAPPVPVPVPEQQAAAPAQPMGDIFAQYNPGSPGDLFAPAHIYGFKPSADAVNAWRAQHYQITPNNIDELRMPLPPIGDKRTSSAGDGVYGPPIPLQQEYGDRLGSLNFSILRAMAQGAPYDIQARRDNIAKMVSAHNQMQQRLGVPPQDELTRFIGNIPRE